MRYEILTQGSSDPQVVECQSVVDRNGFVDFLRVGGASDWVIVLRVQSGSMVSMRLLPEPVPAAPVAPATDETADATSDTASAEATPAADPAS